LTDTASDDLEYMEALLTTRDQLLNAVHKEEVEKLFMRLHAGLHDTSAPVLRCLAGCGGLKYQNISIRRKI
jgi:hypothetical protein